MAASDRYVILTSTRFDFGHFRRRAAADQGPAHLMDQLAVRIGADIAQPGDQTPTLLDRLLSTVVGTPEHWAVARNRVRRIEEGGLLFATGEDVGLATALANTIRRRATVSILVMAPERTRVRWLLRMLDLLGQTPVLVTNTDRKALALEDLLSLPAGTVSTLPEQTDERFFRPLDTGAEREDPPVIASAGMEQRDYRTLAAAVAGLPAEVRVCAVSPNLTSRTTVALPEVLPPNLWMGHLEFDELRDLYRTAAVTAIVLLDNHYSAGLTVLMEAMACRSPVVITVTPGLAEELARKDLVVGVPPGDADALRSALETIILDPATARDRADRAYAYFFEHHTSGSVLDLLAERITRASVPKAAPAAAAVSFADHRVRTEHHAELGDQDQSVRGVDSEVVGQPDRLVAREVDVDRGVPGVLHQDLSEPVGEVLGEVLGSDLEP